MKKQLTYLFDPVIDPVVPIIGIKETFPVHRIYCVGRNYAEHAIEMGSDPDREPPFFFLKPSGAVVPGGGRVSYPPGTKNLHHEIELVVAIYKTGFRIPVEKALDYIYAYAVGLDMTRRDLQKQAREKGRPWDFGKAFDQSAPISHLHPVASHGHHSSGDISLAVNGQMKQKSNLQNMIWSVPETIAVLSEYYTLREGDLIFTGTPAGVSAVERGDRLLGSIEGLNQLEVEIV